ncbi:Uncharacterized protein TCAP_07544 [Tolypocladium capitatum]|uniref:Uncharacterized protein n=1 Tax=Tolypocladium capitatum TaxID=45235 RepID=A0A2K3PSS5_9HYPO|nr:Uncharacterized protein TCAP_07544 [Tolypocladium capitatum]
MSKPRPDVGLAKGYVEALEHRLAVTEDALLQILSVASDDMVESAYGSGGNNPSRTAYTGIAACGEVRKTDLLTRWEQFPLTTAGDVRRWARQGPRRPGRPARPSVEHICGRPALPTLSNTDGEMEKSSASAGNDVLSGELQADHGHGLRESTPPLPDHRGGKNAQTFTLSLSFRKRYLW